MYLMATFAERARDLTALGHPPSREPCAALSSPKCCRRSRACSRTRSSSDAPAAADDPRSPRASLGRDDYHGAAAVLPWCSCRPAGDPSVRRHERGRSGAPSVAGDRRCHALRPSDGRSAPTRAGRAGDTGFATGRRRRGAVRDDVRPRRQMADGRDRFLRDRSLAADAAAAAAAEHGLSPKAVEIARPFGFPITNSMLVTWIVALCLVVFARRATRPMEQVPGRHRRTFSSGSIERLYRFLEGIIGRAAGRPHVLVLRQRLHLHPRRELDRPGSRRRLDRLGTSDRRRLRASSSRCCAAPTPT